MNEIRLVLVDDHDVVRTSLKTYLETHKGFRVVGEANNGETALQVILENQPDVVVMDITMPGMSGLEATRRVKVSSPNCKVLALTIHSDKQYFFEMLSAGALGYLTKQAAAEELIAAIQAVAEGDVYLQPALARWLLEDYQRLVTDYDLTADREKDSKSLEVLSKRELQVLELVAQGLTTPQIAETLGISPKTVARHRERIMNKLDLHSSAKLVKFAIQTGLVKI
ncbi:MAG: response regulator transcription factor [Anaerolineales bacterium]|nr:response regulator transcription factor [Anaerolineales bacterium]